MSTDPINAATTAPHSVPGSSMTATRSSDRPYSSTAARPMPRTPTRATHEPVALASATSAKANERRARPPIVIAIPRRNRPFGNKADAAASTGSTCSAASVSGEVDAASASSSLKSAFAVAVFDPGVTTAIPEH